MLTVDGIWMEFHRNHRFLKMFLPNSSFYFRVLGEMQGSFEETNVLISILLKHF